MKAAEIRELSTKEIQEKIQTEQEALTKMKLNHAITPLDNPNQIREAKKTIARLKTILTERELSK
ncbi:MAG: 50S ribosomal protein L29 [Bacteroidales bacterium]|jgi:large subunit ribosomal protein L29|nr:50S ribosomal protein L29 [Bacteroidales bacterium]MCR4800909.1 50S ribosomal protein L29 [Bacteroidales bacterium]